MSTLNISEFTEPETGCENFFSPIGFSFKKSIKSCLICEFTAPVSMTALMYGAYILFSGLIIVGLKHIRPNSSKYPVSLVTI